MDQVHRPAVTGRSSRSRFPRNTSRVFVPVGHTAEGLADEPLGFGNQDIGLASRLLAHISRLSVARCRSIGQSFASRQMLSNACVHWLNIFLAEAS